MRQRLKVTARDNLETANEAHPVGQRKSKAARCPTCGLHIALCVCPSMPHFALATKLLIVQHHRERHKPTNTARIGLQMFAGAQMVHYGARDTPMDCDPLRRPDHDYILLFPGDEALPLRDAPAPTAGRTRMLMVLDGTWHQCSRMARRAPIVAEMPRYTLPDGPPSRWRIRKAPRPEALSTFEAICRATSVLSKDDPQDSFDHETVLSWFDMLVARMWQMRGTKPPRDEP